MENIMYKNAYYIVAFFVLALLYSCKKDIGNYNYQEVNKAVKFNNLPDRVQAVVGQRLILKPDVEFSVDKTVDTTKYSYEWIFIDPIANRLDTLALTAWLDVNITLPPRAYTFQYRVKDKSTGIQFVKEFAMDVVNEINEGWLLMCSVNGQARLDILSYKNNVFTPIQDLLGTTGSGLELKGKPVMVYTYDTGTLVGPGINLSYGLYVGTDQSTDRIDPNTFKWQSNYNIKYEVFGALPAGFYADAVMVSGGNRSYMLGAGDAYLYHRTNQIKYSVPLNFIDADKVSFKIAPFIATREVQNSENPAVFYDITYKRFVKHIGTASSCTLFPASANTLFSYTTGKDLLYMTWVSYSGGEVFAILKDPQSSKRYLARFDSSDNLQKYYAEIVATDFDKAEYYAVSPEFGYIFYSVGSKVYEYDMSLKTTKLMLDKGANPITLLKFNVFKNSTKYPDVNKLIVCSYDPALPEGSNGKMEQYTVPTINGDLILYKSYTGFGRVKSLNYRER